MAHGIIYTKVEAVKYPAVLRARIYDPYVHGVYRVPVNPCAWGWVRNGGLFSQHLR